MSVEEAVTDPRIERSRSVILRAVLVELSEVGYGALSIESVARRAKAGKSTIYRHWAGKPDLVYDAMESLNRQPGARSQELSAVERVEQVVRHFAEVSVDPVMSGCMVALIDAAERDPELRELHHRYSAQRRQTLVRAIEDGVADGAFPAATDPELAAMALVGAVLYGRLMTGRPVEQDRISTLISQVVADSKSC